MANNLTFVLVKNRKCCEYSVGEISQYVKKSAGFWPDIPEKIDLFSLTFRYILIGIKASSFLEYKPYDTVMKIFQF